MRGVALRTLTRHFGRPSANAWRSLLGAGDGVALGREQRRGSRPEIGLDCLAFLRVARLRVLLEHRLDGPRGRLLGPRGLRVAGELGQGDGVAVQVRLPLRLGGVKPGGHGLETLPRLGDGGVEPCEGLLVLGRGDDHAVLAAADDGLPDVGEERAQRVEVPHRERVELVVVALAQPVVWPSHAAPTARTRSVSMRAS